MQSLRKIHYYSKTHRNVKFKPTSWNSTRLILNQMHIFQHKEKIHFINIRNFTEFCAINAVNVQYYITLAQTTHTHSVLIAQFIFKFMLSYYISYTVFHIFRNINTPNKSPNSFQLFVKIIWSRLFKKNEIWAPQSPRPCAFIHCKCFYTQSNIVHVIICDIYLVICSLYSRKKCILQN